MRGLLSGLCLCVLVAGQDPPVDSRAFIEVRAEQDSWFVHQPFTLTLRFGIDMGFLRTQVIQPFQRRLDLPVRVQSPWHGGLPGGVMLEADDPKGLSCVLDGELSHATELGIEERQGRLFLVYAIARTFTVGESRALDVPPPHLRLDYATRFREDFVSGRVPDDRQVLAITGSSLSLHVEPLPPAGRPRGFTGAVGRFRVQADAEPRVVAVGQSLKLTLVFEAEGIADLTSFPVPQLDDLTDFHVFGHLDQQSAGRRTITYDVTPLSTDVAAVPAIAFRFFDPSPPAQYREVRTAAIPLTVAPPTPGTTIIAPPDAVPRGPVPGVDDIHDLLPFAATPAAPRERTLTPAVRVLVLVAPWALLLCYLAGRSAHRRREGDAAARLARRAAAAFRTRAAEPDAYRAFAVYLAARLQCETATVITPDLPRRLGAAGVPHDLAARAGALLDQLLATRYGRDAEPPDVARALALLDALEAAFDRRPEAAA